MMFSAILREIRTDLPIYGGVAAYAAASYMAAAYWGMEEQFHLFLYANDWLLRGLFIVLPIALTGVLIARAWGRYQAWQLQKDFPRWVAGFCLVALLIPFHGIFTSTKNLLPALFPFTWDVWLADLDETLHGGRAPWELIAPIANLPGVLSIVDFAYSTIWFVAMIAVSGYAAMSSRHSALRYRYFVSFFFVWVFLGNILAGGAMSAGPCFYAQVVGDSERFAGLMAMLPEGSSAARYQAYLWSLFEAGEIGLGTGISAFPSVHLGATTIMTLFLLHVNRRLGWLSLVYLAVIQIGSVQLGWHYAVDGYASILLTVAAWKAIGYALRRPATERGIGRSPAEVPAPAE